jgi:hypothetical protein
MTRKLTAVSLLLLVFVLNVQAQSTIIGQAYAEVIAALTASENNQMNFGKFSPETSGGQIVLTPEGLRMAIGDVVLGGGLGQAGRFIINGEPNASYTIQLPTTPALLTHNGSNKTMVVDNWVSDPPADSGAGILNNGTETVSIGATLIVGPIDNNPVGVYTGTYNLTFAYN